MDYIIGVDGGATKTEAVAYNLYDNELGRACTGFGNLFLDFDKSAQNVINAIKQCIDSIELPQSDKNCQCIYLGLAGIDIGNNKEKIQNLVKEKFGCDAVGYHDSYLAHVAVHKGDDGIIIISGTGSVGYGIFKGRSAKAGGWGHIIGDEGSGYDIAVSAFKRIAYEYDCQLAPSELTKNIINKMNIKDVNEIVKLTYTYSKAEIASFAPIVARLAVQSDINSINILKTAGQHLAAMTARLYNKLKIDEHINIGISGSILLKTDIVKEEFIKCLNNDLNNISIINEIISAPKGACYLHRKNNGS